MAASGKQNGKEKKINKKWKQQRQQQPNKQTNCYIKSHFNVANGKDDDKNEKTLIQKMVLRSSHDFRL
jgi:hypothetical protein